MRRANARKKVAEPADKPGSVVDSHSSRRYVTAALKQPTRIQRGPRQWIPIWSCSRWGLPCRSVTGLAVRSYRTISPLPAPRHPSAASERTWRCLYASPTRFSGGRGVTRDVGGIFLLHFPSACAAQALPGTLPYGARTFLGTLASDATVWPTPPGRTIRYRHRAERRREPAPPSPAGPQLPVGAHPGARGLTEKNPTTGHVLLQQHA